jgi:hypothetical protein
MPDEDEHRPEVIPAVCSLGHITYPSVYVLRDSAQVTLHTDVRIPPCTHEECGQTRVIKAGVYRADEDGRVYRAGDAPPPEHGSNKAVPQVNSRLLVAWRILRGRPVAYKVTLDNTGGITMTGDHALIIGCTVIGAAGTGIKIG